MNKIDIIAYLKNKKDELHKSFGITTLGLYGSYARDEATELSDIDIYFIKEIVILNLKVDWNF